MTTTAPPRPDAAAPATQDDPTPPRGRFAQWRSTWSVALRIARRDVRRHRGRSTLVMLMVAVPTMLLSTVITITTTARVEGAETIPQSMGSGQALVQGPQSGVVVQGPDGGGASITDKSPLPVPGYRADADAFANADAISSLLGAPVSPIEPFTARTTVGDRRVTVEGEALDGSVGLGERLRLESGRWPRGAGEALVTASSIAQGLPSSGTITVSVDDRPLTFAVVGIADRGRSTPTVGLVTAVPPPQAAIDNFGTGWIVRGDDPVTWAQVRKLNRYGFAVDSADVLRNPPAESEVPIEARLASESADEEIRLITMLGSAMLLIACTLLAGPAFAVSAARQRRSLALAASNGATAAVMRRTVLSQAMVLGGVSAVAGTLLGVAGAAGIARWAERDGQAGLGGPFDVHPIQLAAVTGCALLSSVVAALLPARRLGRLDIVRVMRGQNVSPRPSRLLFIAGAMLFAAAAATILATNGAPTAADSELLSVCTVGLIVGALFFVPVILAAVGRLGRRMPTSLRMAARDLARHRARSGPAVASILAVVAGLTFTLVAFESTVEQANRLHVPSTLVGEAEVSARAEKLDEAAAAVRQALPGAIIEPFTEFRPKVDPNAVGNASARIPFVSIVPPGCQPAPGFTAGALEAEPNPRCPVEKIIMNQSNGDVLVLPAAELARRFGLDAAQTRQLRDGAVLVRGLDGPKHRVVRGSYISSEATPGTGPAVRIDQDRTVPAVVVPKTKQTLGAMFGLTIAFAADATFTRGWELFGESLSVRTADGSAITDTQVEQLQQQLGDEAYIMVERGGRGQEDRITMVILVGVLTLLILIVTLTSTALTLAEQQTDQATLAALGATRSTRRAMAAAQAFLLAAVGCLLGVAVGIVPGIAVARSLTVEQTPGGMFAIPWTMLLVIGVLVPAAAATMAAAGIRRAPVVTRRAG
jgi:putative ABC transport system permease protein